MSGNRITKAMLAWSLGLIIENALAEDEMRWFRNELICADTKVTVRSYCRNEVKERVNTLCTKQTLILEKPDSKKIRRNLLEKEPSRGYFHSVRSLRCVTGNNRHYLYVSLGNGGNCSTCENEALLDLNGYWKRYGERWYAPSIERKDIARREDVWFKNESVLLNNKIED